MGIGKHQTPDVRRRALLVAVAIMLMTLISAYTAINGSSPGNWRPVDLVQAGALLLLVVVLSTRSTTSFALFGRNTVLDDELTRANRASAARYGFWSLMLGLLASFVISLWLPVQLTQVALILMALGAASAALRFVALEHAGDG